MSEWLRVPAEVVPYARVSERTIEHWAREGLRYVKVRGCRLTKTEWVDEFLISHEATRDQVKKRLDKIVNDLCRGFK